MLYVIGFLYILLKGLCFPFVLVLQYFWDFNPVRAWKASKDSLFKYFYAESRLLGDEITCYYENIHDFVHGRMQYVRD